MAISDVWHFVEGSKRAGPFTEEEMRVFVRQGRVRSDTLVWCDGMTDWMPLHQSKGAALLLAAERPVVQAVPPMPRGGFSENVTVTEGSGPGRPMGFFEAISSCFSKYAQFSGRASRSELWYFALFYFLCALAVGGLEGIGSTDGSAAGLVFLGFLLPSLAVAVRRLHDTDRSGWWLFIHFVPLVGAIVLLVFYCLAPTPGRNRFN